MYMYVLIMYSLWYVFTIIYIDKQKQHSSSAYRMQYWEMDINPWNGFVASNPGLIFNKIITHWYFCQQGWWQQWHKFKTWGFSNNHFGMVHGHTRFITTCPLKNLQTYVKRGKTYIVETCWVFLFEYKSKSSAITNQWLFVRHPHEYCLLLVTNHDEAFALAVSTINHC